MFPRDILSRQISKDIIHPQNGIMQINETTQHRISRECALVVFFYYSRYDKTRSRQISARVRDNVNHSLSRHPRPSYDNSPPISLETRSNRINWPNYRHCLRSLSRWRSSFPRQQFPCGAKKRLFLGAFLLPPFEVTQYPYA